MLILAFDTSVAACSVALWSDGRVLAARRAAMDQGQAEALMPLIEEVMTDGRTAYTELDRIAVSIGPGSFTGVRVGLAAARGLALAANVPLVGVLTTEILAASVAAEEWAGAGAGAHVLAAIDTKRGDIYVQQFDQDMRAPVAVCALAPAELGTWVAPGRVLVVGDAAAAAAAAIGPRAVLSSADALPAPAVLARLASERLPQPGGPLPVYVRSPDAVMPQHGGRLRP